MTNKAGATIKEYIEAAPPEARAHLRQLHLILRSVAPEGTGRMKWGVPVFWDRGMLFGFAAYKTHVSFGAGQAAISRFADELSAYTTGKGTVQLPYGQPFPEDLIRRMATFCIENR